MLSIGNAENDGNDSWDSSRGAAQVVDLSNQVPANTSGLEASVKARSKRPNYLNATPGQEYGTASRLSHGNMSHSGSAAQLTVQNDLNNIEDAVDLSARGSHEEGGFGKGGSQSMLHKESPMRLSAQGGMLDPNSGIASNSMMQMTYQGRPPATSQGIMADHQPNSDAFIRNSNQNMRASHEFRR